MLAAARRRFESDGYTVTSMPAIAAEARVAVKTVYLVFGTKAQLLRAVWEDRLAADEATVSVLERAWFRELAATDDPRMQIRLLAEQSRKVKSRSGALLQTIESAAAVDPDVAVLWDDIEAKLVTVAQAVVDLLVEARVLKTGLDAATATDLLWLHYHPSTWHLLVARRGWDAQAYANWLERALVDVLLTDRP